MVAIKCKRLIRFKRENKLGNMFLCWQTAGAVRVWTSLKNREYSTRLHN